MPGRRTPSRRASSATGGGTPAAVGSLVLTPTTLGLSIEAGETETFGEQTFTLSNGGPGSWANPQYEISYSAATGWLSFVITDDGTRTFTPVVDASALSASTQTATITFTDSSVSNSGQTVTITLTVFAAPVLIALSPPALSSVVVDETSGNTLTTTISGIGGSLTTPTVGTITYSGAFTDWVTATSVTDNLDGTFLLELDVTGVGGTVGGPYVATVPVLSSGASNSPLDLTVSLTVSAGTGAILSVDRVLDDTRGAAQTVGVRSANNNPLAGPSVSSTSYTGALTGWAGVSLSGTSLTVTPDLTGQPDGTGYCHVDLVDANSATGVRYSVVLTNNVAAPTPTLSVSPAALGPTVTAGGSPGNSQLAVTNPTGSIAGLGTVTAQFTAPVSWATLSYASGTVTVAYSTASLAAGTYSATLRVSASLAANSPVDVPVLLTVQSVSAAFPAPRFTLPSFATFNTSTDEIENEPMAVPALGTFS
jgi:hypothetical protein